MVFIVLIYKIQIEIHLCKMGLSTKQSNTVIMCNRCKCYCVANAVMLIRVHSCSRLIFVVCIGITSILVLYRVNCILIQIFKENHIIKHVNIGI